MHSEKTQNSPITSNPPEFLLRRHLHEASIIFTRPNWTPRLLNTTPDDTRAQELMTPWSWNPRLHPPIIHSTVLYPRWPPTGLPTRPSSALLKSQLQKIIPQASQVLWGDTSPQGLPWDGPPAAAECVSDHYNAFLRIQCFPKSLRRFAGSNCNF